MTVTKKAPGSVGALPEAVNRTEGNKYPSGHYYSTTIAGLLQEGAENAITGADLQRILGLSDGRTITQLVERERRSGIPICASCDAKSPGYFLPRNPAELTMYTKSLRGRVRNVTRTLDAMERALDEWTGQQRMEGF